MNPSASRLATALVAALLVAATVLLLGGRLDSAPSPEHC
jgi:hypothetical protein